MEKEKKSQNIKPGADLSQLPNAGKAMNKEGEGAAARRWYTRKKVLIPVALFIIAGFIVFWYWDTYLRGYVSTDDAYITGNRVAVSAKMLGRIAELTVNEGDTVSAGQFLVQLDTSDLHAQRIQALSNLEYAGKNAELIRVNLSLAQEDFKRAEVQYENKIIPQEQYDHARQARDRAQAQYNVALAQIKTAKSQVLIIETLFANAHITAPVSGTVAKRWVLAGDVVQPAQPIFTIYSTQDIWVEANFDETKISAIRLNDPVEISVDAYAGKKFEGRVFEIGAAAASQFSLIPPNNASGNFTKVAQRVPFKISIKQADSQSADNNVFLLPGMSVTVKVRVKGEKNVR